MNTKEISVFKQALQSAETIFLHPPIIYPYENIIRGVTVNGTRKKAVGVNTMQAFGKKLTYGNFGENKIKAMEVCDAFFLSQKDRILEKFYWCIRTREDMDAFEHELFQSLQEALLPYTTTSMIHESYNRTRKIVELYLEHIVAMASEIENENRKSLIPLLFLPMDSWIIGDELIFDGYSISRWGLTRKSSFGLIKTRSLFDDMQRYLVEKAKELSMVLDADFHVIYFDVFWGDRLNIPSCNLFGEQATGSKTIMKAYKEETLYSDGRKLEPSELTERENKGSVTSYPPLLWAIIGELAALGIFLGKAYKCIQRNDGAYILEALFPRGQRKNIVTIWSNKQGGGDIRIVSIGKYEKRRRFDQADIGTNAFRADLRMAYNSIQ